MNPESSSSSFVKIAGYDRGKAILRGKDFDVEDVEAKLSRLQEASGEDFSRLIARMEYTPFFITGEKHRAVRRRMARFYSPAGVAEWQATIDDIVASVVTPLLARDRIELVSEVVEPIILRLQITVFGLAETDLETTREWGTALVQLFSKMPSLRHLRRLQDVYEGAAAHVAKPPEQPSAQDAPKRPPSLREALAKPPAGMEPLSKSALETLVAINAVATYALTTSLSNILAQRVSEPGGVARCADREWLGANFDNIIRLGAAPNEIIRRLAVGRSDLAPDLVEGGMVGVTLREMNRDTDFIESGCPHTLEKASRHIGFGAGAHICPGMALSHIVIRSVLTAFGKHLPDLNLNGDDPLDTAETGPLFLHTRITCSVRHSDGR